MGHFHVQPGTRQHGSIVPLYLPFITVQGKPIDAEPFRRQARSEEPWRFAKVYTMSQGLRCRRTHDRVMETGSAHWRTLTFVILGEIDIEIAGDRQRLARGDV